MKKLILIIIFLFSTPFFYNVFSFSPEWERGRIDGMRVGEQTVLDVTSQLSGCYCSLVWDNVYLEFPNVIVSYYGERWVCSYFIYLRELLAHPVTKFRLEEAQEKAENEGEYGKGYFSGFNEKLHGIGPKTDL